MEMDLQYGLGFHLPGAWLELGGHRSFGHYGAGGSVGFADPDAELGFAYVMNRMILGLTGDPRPSSLIDATYGSLAR
jgi:CubicO group peptidase (beta-lactamase class C family)